MANDKRLMLEESAKLQEKVTEDVGSSDSEESQYIGFDWKYLGLWSSSNSRPNKERV